jgi:Cysteine rich repeat
VADARVACAPDIQKLCAGVSPGGGRIVACLKQHQQEVSDGCKQAVLAATEPQQTAQPQQTSPAPEHASKSKAGKASASGERYYRMKQVKLIDQAAGQGRPAYDLMIPTAWQFKGWVNVGVAEGGCFADWFNAVGDAKSEDGALELQIAPQMTWQYMDDPAGQRQMQQMNQRRSRAGVKPCPVRAPVHAADYLGKDLLPRYRKGKSVVSIEPFPELDAIARHRLGLPPEGGASGGIRTEAARARVAFDDEHGQPVEEWWTIVIVVRSFPAGGRGAAYDWHAVNSMVFRAPKGKLDANDKLFKLIASTIRPEPEWQQWSNGVIADLYRRQAKEEAIQGDIISKFQAHVADTINAVVANQQQGSYASAAGADRLTRGVQVFRDPSSGASFELSNQYDHAWLNGSNEYVMSDDPNFSPNGKLDGNWTQLQPVR